jgi:hypothetical protein
MFVAATAASSARGMVLVTPRLLGSRNGKRLSKDGIHLILRL